MPLNSLQDLYVEHLQDLYSAEQQILQALPKLIQKASNDQLRKGFEKHFEQTQEHAQRLEQIGGRLGRDLDGKKCKGMEGLLKEGDEMLKETGDPNVIDAALISAAQRVEHYEIAAYGCARTYADALGFEGDVELLQHTLDEEGDTDKLLTKVAERVVNPEAQKAIPVERESGARGEARE